MRLAGAVEYSSTKAHICDRLHTVIRNHLRLDGAMWARVFIALLSMTAIVQAAEEVS